MKDKFGHLQDEGDKKTRDQELRGGQPSRDDQYSEEFQEDQKEVRDQIIEQNAAKRELELRRDNDTGGNEISSSVMNVDYAVTYELDQNFDFHVKQNSKQIKVPVIWDGQERWTWARQRRDLKSVKDKVLLPLIVIDRNDISEHPSHVTRPDLVKLNNAGRTFTIRQRYSKDNRYDQFTALNNVQPKREYQAAQVPDFIQVSYDLMIYTEYRWQMDNILDMIQHYNYSYWGDDEESGRIFYTQVESMNTEIEMTDEARFVQADIGLSVDGYIVPEELQDGPAVKKYTSTKTVDFEETVKNDLNE